jgi:large subunit ribosomal protein L32e
MQKLTKLSSAKKRRLPKFRRQEWFRFKRLGEKWRKPKGKNSKMRLCIKGKAKMPSIGYRLPKVARGLHPSGLLEVIVHTVEDIDRLDPKRQAARIASGVGKKKREQIIKRANELGIRVLNPGGVKLEAEHTEKTSG